MSSRLLPSGLVIALTLGAIPLAAALQSAPTTPDAIEVAVRAGIVLGDLSVKPVPQLKVLDAAGVLVSLPIFRLPASGGEMKPVTTFPGSGLFMEKPTLSPDGRSLADCRWNGGSLLWLLSIDHDRSQAP